MNERHQTTSAEQARSSSWWATILVGVLIVLAIVLLFYGSVYFADKGKGDSMIATLEPGTKEFAASGELDCGVTNSGLEELVREHPDLEVLSLTQCPQVTNDGVRLIGELKALKKLTLQGRPGFDEEAFACLQDCESLTELGLAGFEITTRAADLIVRISTLERIGLTTSMVSEEALKVILGRRPNLKIRWY